MLRLGGLAGLAGLSGCASLPFVGTLGFRLRNYTTDAYDARVQIRLYGQTAFDRTYRLPAADPADPHVLTETDAVSNVPSGATYTCSLFLDGVKARSIETTADCTDRESQQMDEEVDIDIGFGGDGGVEMADTEC